MMQSTSFVFLTIIITRSEILAGSSLLTLEALHKHNEYKHNECYVP